MDTQAKKIRSYTRKWMFSVTTCLFSTALLLSPACHSSSASASNPADASTPSEYSQVSREYHLKAAFLRYVAQYVEFPANTEPEGMVNLCVLGQVPYFEGINSINGKVVNNRAIVISKIISIDEAKGHCQIVFIAKTETDKIKDIVTAYQAQPILPFGDMEHFSEQGGGMNFYIANNRLAIMTNLKVIEKSNLKISPQMLKLVTLVPH